MLSVKEVVLCLAYGRISLDSKFKEENFGVLGYSLVEEHVLRMPKALGSMISM